MTIDLVTGSRGTPHIDGNKWGALNAGIIGSADYVLQMWNQFNLIKNTSVQLTLDTGCGVMNGRQVVITAPETITVTPAAAGQQRNDLICLRYTYDQQARTEKATVAVVQGSPVGSGTPADPKTNTDSIINQSTTVHDYPLWRVRVNNTGASSLTRLFSVLAPMASAWDSLNQNASKTIAIDRSGTTTADDYFRFEGQILPLGGSTTSAMALINIGWTNAGSFHSNAWESTRLCKMTEWKPVMEGHQVACENADKFHYSMFYWYPEGWITWQASEAWQVPENCWHNATFNFLVTKG